MFDLFNAYRKNPKSLIPTLETQLTYFSSSSSPNLMIAPGGKRLMTNEGPTVYQETIAFLKTQQPVGEVAWNDDLFLAAVSHYKD